MHKTRHKRAFRFWMFLLFFFGCLLGGFWLFEAHFAAIVRDTAETAVKAKAAYIIKDAIAEQTAKDKITYDSLVTFEKDKNGSITALKTNTTAINRFKSALFACIVNALEQTKAVGFEIPARHHIAERACRRKRGRWCACISFRSARSKSRVKNSLESAGYQSILPPHLYLCPRGACGGDGGNAPNDLCGNRSVCGRNRGGRQCAGVLCGYRFDEIKPKDGRACFRPLFHVNRFLNRVMRYIPKPSPVCRKIPVS